MAHQVRKTLTADIPVHLLDSVEEVLSRIASLATEASDAKQMGWGKELARIEAERDDWYTDLAQVSDALASHLRRYSECER